MLGENGCAAPRVGRALPLIVFETLGLMPSAEPLLGGVGRFPTLDMVVTGGGICVCRFEYGYFESLKVGRGISKLGTFARRWLKLGGAPMCSSPGSIGGGYATTAATFAVACSYEPAG